MGREALEFRVLRLGFHVGAIHNLEELEWGFVQELSPPK